MTGKIKRRSLRCGGRPKADFGSIFTTFIAPALGVAGSVADSAISKAQASKVNTKPAIKETKTEVTNNNTSVENLPTTQAPTKDPISGLVTSNTVIPPDPTKTPTMRLGGRKKCWIGAAIMGATSIAGSLFGAAAQKREMRRQKNIQDWQNTTQEAANMTSTLNNSQDYQEDYLRQFRTAARLGKTLGAKGIYITDGGDATKIDNNTYLLRGGSHEDVNETGQTGIGINVGGNEVEAEGGEVAQKKNDALRIFSAQPILGNGMSPAQAILRGYNKDKVFSQQQAFKKRNGLKDDGSKAAFGNLINIPDIANKIVEYFSGTGRYASKPVKVTPKTVAKKPIRNGQVGNFRVVNGRYISNEKPLRRVYPEFDIISMGRGLPVGKAAKATARAAKNEVSYINRISKSRLYSDNPIVNTYATYARRYNLPDKARVPYMIRRVKSEEFPSINNGRITMSGGRFKHTNFTYDRPVVSHRKGKWDTAQQTYLINGRTLVSENKGNWGSIEPSDMFTVRDPKGGLTVPTKDVILVSGHKGVLSQAKASGIKTATSPQLQSREASITPRESLGRFNFAGGERRHYDTPYWISVNDIVKEYGTPKFKDVRLLEKMTGLKSGVSKLDKNAMKIINDAKGFDKLPLNEAEQVMKQTYPNGRGVNFINDRESYITSELPYNSLFYDPATHAEVNYVFPKRLGGRCRFRNGGLTSKDRGSSKHPYPSVSSKDFAGGGRSYPIPTKADAVDALRLAGLHGRSDVKAKVYSRYPELRKKARGGIWVKPVYNTSKYRGTSRARKQIAKWEGSDFAGQNAQFKGDAIGAKERELRQFMGKAYNYLNDNQRDALLSYYYNLVPKTFRGQMTKYRNALINAQTEQEYNDTLNNMRESINVGANRKGMRGLRNRRAIERNWFSYNYANPLQEKVDNNLTQVPDATKVVQPIIQQPVITKPIEVNPQEGYVPSDTPQGINIPQGRLYDYIKDNSMKRRLRCGGRVSRPVKGMRPKAELGWLGYPYPLPRKWDFTSINLGNYKPSILSKNYPYARGMDDKASQLENSDNYRDFSLYRTQLDETNPYVQALTKSTGHSWNDIKANNYNLRYDHKLGYNHFTPEVKEDKYGIWGEPIEQKTWLDNDNTEIKGPYNPQKVINSSVDTKKTIPVDTKKTTEYDIRDNKFGMTPSTGDWIGLGIDTLAGLAGGIINYNAAKDMYIPGRAPIMLASKLPTNYNITPQLEEVKRMRDRLTGETYRNTSSSVAALNRAGNINLNSLNELSKLWTTKENEENNMLTQDALNQQSVAETNIRNQMARESEIAQYKNAQNQAKYDSINASLTGLAQAYNNFYTNATKRYEDEVAMRTYLAGAENATPYRMLSMGVPMSQDALIGIYNQIGSINNPGPHPERKDYDSNASWSRAVDKWERDNTLYRQRGEYRNMVNSRLNKKSRLRLGIR